MRMRGLQKNIYQHIICRFSLSNDNNNNKGGLDFSNPPVYNELKKGIQMQNLMPSVKFYILCISHSIQNFPRVVDAISYYVDLYKSKPQKLPIVKSILPLYSWASPSFKNQRAGRNCIRISFSISYTRSVQHGISCIAIRNGCSELLFILLLVIRYFV